MLINAGVDLVLIAGAIVFVSQILQIVLIDRKEFRKNQKEMKAKSQEHRELLKKGGASKDEIDRVQREMMELTTKSMKHMPKMMIGSILVVLPLFVFATSIYHEAKIDLFFPLTLVWDQADWFWWYMLCSLIISFTVNRVLALYEDRAEKKILSGT
ncbi:MAG: EMC3/TMCO1 family protein [Candidatus Diapherotrites archaeon]|nr:EMC3/TMCO1 family protein [Candidatus Diapherotrites archaeon]MDZ4256021.1 EMC3/TMCO1 family protein [archaeon]